MGPSPATIRGRQRASSGRFNRRRSRRISPRFPSSTTRLTTMSGSPTQPNMQRRSVGNAIAPTHDLAHATAEHEHVSLPQHRHHFETEEQQREAGSFGMWLFLLTEIMFFGGMFFAYLLYRNWYYDAFVAASNQLNVKLGAANTAILITSGFFMALGVWAAEVRKKNLLVIYLILTPIFRFAFLGLK